MGSIGDGRAQSRQYFDAALAVFGVILSELEEARAPA